MNFDDHMKKVIREAEHATPAIEVKSSVVSPANEEFKSEDQRQYEYMYTRLPLNKRSSLAYDYETYRSIIDALTEFQNTSRTCLANSAGNDLGPLLLKLTRPLFRPPRDWRVCGVCSGSGTSDEIAKCNACGGHGYFV